MYSKSFDQVHREAAIARGVFKTSCSENMQ